MNLHNTRIGMSVSIRRTSFTKRAETYTWTQRSTLGPTWFEALLSLRTVSLLFTRCSTMPDEIVEIIVLPKNKPGRESNGDEFLPPLRVSKEVREGIPDAEKRRPEGAAPHDPPPVPHLRRTPRR